MKGFKMKNKSQKNKKIPLIIAGILVLIIVAVYAGISMHYQNYFLPNTSVNGVDASGRSWEAVETELVSVMDTYVLTITGRNNIEDTIASGDIDMKMDFGERVKNAQEAQNEWTWPIALFKGSVLTLDSAVSYDEEKLAEKIESMNCMDDEQAAAPEDAYISEYEDGTGFSVVPEKENNKLNQETFENMICEALTTLSSEITLDMLEEKDAYLHPSVYQDDETLNSLTEQMNKLTKVTLTYEFGDNTEIVTGKTIAEWISVDDDHVVSLDSDKVREYVNSLARKYDTFDTAGSRSFKTSYDTTIDVEGGDYGWWMNRPDTTDELIAAVEAGEDKELTPVYYQTAASYSDNDYGDTYVEINLTAQRLFLYKDGELILTTDFVSGKPSIKNSPSGVYGITYKERAHTMTGDASDPYRVETSFWMPFAGNVGLHDATWRTQFGGTLYKSSGSHGCINLPYNAAKTIYQTVDAGTPVICYRLDGTERSSTTTQSNTEIANIGIDAIERIGTVSKDNYAAVKKKIEWARQVYTDLSSSQRALVTNYQTLVDAENALKALQ